MISFNNELEGNAIKDCWSIDFSEFEDDLGNRFVFPSFNTVVESSIRAVKNDENKGAYKLLDPEGAGYKAALCGHE